MDNTEARTMNSSRITLINVIEAPAESIEQFISDWKADKDFMIRQPGFIDVALYRSLQSDARFRFVNEARWKSEDDWKAAIEAGEKLRAGKGIDRLSGWTDLGIKGYPATYREEMRY
jgi:heme-degrading monooxygenase HmoA